MLTSSEEKGPKDGSQYFELRIDQSGITLSLTAYGMTRAYYYTVQVRSNE